MNWSGSFNSFMVNPHRPFIFHALSSRNPIRMPGLRRHETLVYHHIPQTEGSTLYKKPISKTASKAKHVQEEEMKLRKQSKSDNSKSKKSKKNRAQPISTAKPESTYAPAWRKRHSARAWGSRKGVLLNLLLVASILFLVIAAR